MIPGPMEDEEGCPHKNSTDPDLGAGGKEMGWMDGSWMDGWMDEWFLAAGSEWIDGFFLSRRGSQMSVSFGNLGDASWGG